VSTGINLRLARTARIAAGLLAAWAMAPALAAFHLFTINEAYSDATGTVQYVELTALAGGQQFTQGHTLTSTDGTTTRTFFVPANLPGDTSGRKMLFGTAGVQAAFGVTPDYIIPDGFLHTTVATINWGENSDTWSHAALPNNGVSSLNRSGAPESATPQNFAGVTGAVPPQTYQGLWWAAPAGSESGWGLNIAHQGDTLFGTWFTYDFDGSGMWIVMPSATRMGPGVYGGLLYRTTGAPFNDFPTNALVNEIAVGSATLTFASPTQATFRYTLYGVSQTKQIVPQLFATPVPTCTAGGPAGATANYQGLWWRSPAGSEAGWGLNIAHQGNTLFATWFTYDASRRGMWLVMSSGVLSGPSTYSGALFRTTGNAFGTSPWSSATVAVTMVGNASLAFSDAANGTFTYTVNGVTQSKPITRQQFSAPASVCRAN
jgi:hypothetical protein